MATIYLSPSTQEGNFYVNGGTEEEWMNRLADELVVYLTASGIQYVRNTPQMTAASSIRASNAGRYDLHLALHSNAAPEGQYGSLRGILIFYYPGNFEGQRAAQLIAGNLKDIYPLPNLVRAVPNATVGEVRLTRAPAVFIELGYHDNPDDAAWIKSNLNTTARAITLALTEYFRIPFFEPGPTRQGMVDVEWGALNIRYRPDRTAPIVARVYDGARLTVINGWQGWYLVNADGAVGYADSRYITLV